MHVTGKFPCRCVETACYRPWWIQTVQHEWYCYFVALWFVKNENHQFVGWIRNKLFWKNCDNSGWCFVLYCFRPDSQSAYSSFSYSGAHSFHWQTWETRKPSYSQYTNFMMSICHLQISWGEKCSTTLIDLPCKSCSDYDRFKLM